MNFSEQLARIRRKLRDPEGKIWARSLIVDTYNDCQKEIQVKTKFLESISILGIPPLYDAAYTHDWEWRHLPVGSNRAYRCIRYSEQGGFAFCHRFESEMFFGENNSLPDEGYHFTQPWEAFLVATPGEPVRFKFPSDFHTTTYIAYDRKPLDFEQKKNIQLSDASYINTSGEPHCYYREDDLDNEFVLYPKPEADFEDDDDDDQVDINNFLVDPSSGSQYLSVEISPGVFADLALSLFDNDEDDLGPIVFNEGYFLSQESGVDIEILDDQDKVILVYKGIGRDIDGDDDESNFPKFLRKYIEHGVLEQCYGSNNDGRIQSLAEYWRYRYMTGIQMIKKFMIIRKQDRVYCMQSSDRPPMRNQRHPRLPSNYPAN